jgi:hypothetical protein
MHYKILRINAEVNCTEPSPTVGVPCHLVIHLELEHHFRNVGLFIPAKPDQGLLILGKAQYS